MKIFLYLTHYPPAGEVLGSGTAKAVQGLAGGLTAAGAQVVVLAEGAEVGSYQDQGGFQVRRFQRDARYATFRPSPGLRSYLEQDAIGGLVVLNGAFHPSVNALARWLRRRRIPYVVCPHDPYHPALFKKKPLLKRVYWQLLEKPMLRRAVAVQLLDPRHGEWLSRRGVDTPVIAAPNGFDPTQVPGASAVGSVGHNESGRARRARLFFLGRIDVEQKGLDLLVEALAGLEPDAAELVIQGPAWQDAASLKRMIDAPELRRRATIRPPDFVRRPVELMIEHDIYCLPSRFEGFGLAALEAMLARRVVLVSEIAGIAPHVEDSGCGVVVRPEVAAIRTGLETLLARREEWAEMGEKGRAHVLRYLDWTRIGEEVLDSYRQLVPTAYGAAKPQPAERV